MKNYLLILIVIFCFSSQAYACDVCGCTLSHNVLPSDTRTFIGVGMRQSVFGGRHLERGVLKNFRESYGFYDFAAKWSIKNRWELMATLPIVAFTQHTEGVVSDKINGFGDLNLTARYALINRVGLENHRLSVGVTIELPVGKYKQTSDDGAIYHARQTGSGATNFVASVSYGYKRQTWGVQTLGSLKFNSTNPLGYHRGNSVNGALDFFIKKTIKTVEIYPKAGIIVESSQRNQLNGVNYALNTARTFTVGTLGCDAYWNHFFLSANYQLPIFQSLETDQLRNLGRVALSVNYVF